MSSRQGLLLPLSSLIENPEKTGKELFFLVFVPSCAIKPNAKLNFETGQKFFFNYYFIFPF